jgi:hypothetical protein
MITYQDRAERLYAYLDGLADGSTLASMDAIGDQLHFPVAARAWSVCCAFDTLQRQLRLTTAHGTRSHCRGQRIVRMPDGRTFKTAGCVLVLDLEEARP